MDDGDWLFCGHVHTKQNYRRNEPRVIHVALEASDLFPISELEILNLIHQVEKI